MKLEIRPTLATALLFFVSPALAEAPELKTPAPVIYLADNLDEKDALGWCIDTLGRGFGERVQAHSCKPQGGDVQFSLDAEAGLIRSVAYPDYCMAYDPNDTSTFGLTDCDPDAENQQFSYEVALGEIRLTRSPENCVVVGAQSRSAGPFMSRTLDLAECAAASETLKSWVVLR